MSARSCAPGWPSPGGYVTGTGPTDVAPPPEGVHVACPLGSTATYTKVVDDRPAKAACGCRCSSSPVRKRGRGRRAECHHCGSGSESGRAVSALPNAQGLRVTSPVGLPDVKSVRATRGLGRLLTCFDAPHVRPMRALSAHRFPRCARLVTLWGSSGFPVGGPHILCRVHHARGSDFVDVIDVV